MNALMLSELARMSGGRLHGEDRPVDALMTDTRVPPSGQAPLFVALKGENFDGHDHVAAALQAGAVAALVSRLADLALPQVLVADTERALADLAANLQRTRATRVVALTGSNGKTTVKTLLLAILGESAFTASGTGVYANPGNRNNEIGLPLAVIDAPHDAAVAVYEMGAGKPGDIAYLTRIARPHVALVTNIAPAHLERMGSLLGVADTKAAVYDALPPEGVAVINADDAFAPYFGERAHGRRLIRFGLESSADVSARDIRTTSEGSAFTLVTPVGEAGVALALGGRHNIANALAAAGVALGLGMPVDAIARGLGSARPVPGRLVAHDLGAGAVLVDDSYNANPGSLSAAIDTLADAPADGWLVLGDMRELGADAEAMHAQAGRRARAAGLCKLFALGPLSSAAAAAFGDGGQTYDTHADLAAALRAQLDEAARQTREIRVLVKGSRGSAMDKIVTALLSTHRGDNDAA